ncbi:MAG: PDZ domain-containing protein [Phycisphaerales bacterium]
MRIRWFKCLAVILAVLTATHARGQESVPSVTLERRIFTTFRDGDYDTAVRLIEQYLAEHPHHPIMLYNAACAYSLMGEPDRSASYLIRAVQAGFRDLDQIVGDPDLEAIREHPKYRVVIQRLQRRAAATADNALDLWRATYGAEHYRYERDEQRRIAYATALDPVSHREMRRMLQREADHLQSALFDVEPRSYLLIAVPTPSDGDRIFTADNIGGIYEHAQRRLIARDIGGALRHEFVHALHYVHMDQLRQRHPLWIQEGLASLFEDYTLHDDGTIQFLPNERHNIVKNRARAGRLMKWKNLFVITDDRFMAKAGQLYPQVRSIFEFVADQGKLTQWYESLIANFREDTTGLQAFELCFDMPLDEIERAWRRWLTTRPKIDTTISLGDASLGIQSRPNGSNDGVLIQSMLPGSAARRSQLRVGDVIVSIDGEPTRALAELQAIIGSKRVGDRVRVRARRAGDYLTVVVTLRPLRW